jgi:hypothetical protein
MKTRTTAHQHARGGSWLGNATAIGFALVPLGVMLWAVPQTGLAYA